jgi:hypothetical protein
MLNYETYCKSRQKLQAFVIGNNLDEASAALAETKCRAG